MRTPAAAKSLLYKRLTFRVPSLACYTLALSLFVGQQARAASSTFADTAGTTPANFSDGSYWSTGAAPGATDGTFTNTDTAFFANTTAVTINIDQANQNLGFISYLPGVAADTISGNPLYLTSGGAIYDSRVATAGSQTISSALVLEPTSGTGNGAYSIIDNNTTDIMSIGAISGGTTTGAITLTLGGTTNTSTTGTSPAISVFGNTVNGVISNGGAASLGLTKIGSGSWILLGANTYTGATTVAGGTLYVGNGFTSGSTGTTTGSISASSPLILAGGALNYAPTSANQTQSFAGTTLNAGLSSLTAVGYVPGTTTALTETISLGAITRNTGSILNLGTGNFTTTTTTNSGGTILGGYAVVGKAGWAVAPTTAGGAITTLAASGYTNDTFTAGTNTNVTTTETVAAGSTTNSLRFNNATTSVTLTLGGSLTVSSGGILITPNSTTILQSIVGGTITSGNGTDLILTSNQGGVVTIGSSIVDNGAYLSIGFTTSSRGTVVASGYNTYSGATTVNGGLQIAAATNSGVGWR